MTCRASLVVLSLGFLAGIGSAQTSDLWLLGNDTTNVYVVRNGQIVQQFNRASLSDGPAAALQTTVKMFGLGPGNSGAEYSYAGAPLAGQYPNPAYVDCYDAATDGTARNWTIAHNDFTTNFAVIVGDANWGNLQVAFVPANRSSGIAYDATDDSLWITNNVGGSNNIQHFTTGGVLLGEFPINMGSGGGYGLALDPADQTLWVPGAYGTQGRLDQHDKNGNFLQSVFVPISNVTGAEFRGVVPMSTFCTAGTTTNGCTASIAGSGSPSASASSGFTISATGVEGNKQGILFYGIDNSGFTPLAWGPSTSFLCVKSPAQRMGVQNSGGTAGQCDGQLSIDWNAFRAANPSALGSPFGAGDDFFSQAWFRDPPSPKSTMLSNALKFVLAP